MFFAIGCTSDADIFLNAISISEKPQVETLQPEKKSEENLDPEPEISKPQNAKKLKSVEEIEIFPRNHPLNSPISNMPIDKNSNNILKNIGLDVGLFADFGSGTYKGEPIGMPYVIVGKNQPRVPIVFRANNLDENYSHQSDSGPFPIPLNAPIEPKFATDAHVIAVDVDNEMLYELYNAEQIGQGWEASSAAVFDLKGIEYRPEGWTSADAAGLPIFPLLVRYSEVETQIIDHAIRFSLSRSKIYSGYVHPARHMNSGSRNNDLLPFGGRLRLRPDYDISSFSPTNQIILRALKKYGLILADVGVDMYLKGSPDSRWNNIELRELKKVKIRDFEVIELGEIITK